ncbi:MAG: J domain-containing protein, partial [Nitrospirota bacterium]|nr:J domain-containing protein [Nitrospirota bacterium]
SEIDGLNSDISGLKAEIIRARQQTDLKSALIGDLKKEMRGVREKLGEKEMGDRTLAYNVLQMLMELFLKAAEHAGGGPMEKTVIITGERLEALREDLLSGRLSNSEFIAAAFGLFDRILDIQAGTRPGKIPGPAMKGSCAWGLNPGMDASEAQKVYKFLRVAFHPDRFHASRHVTVADRMFKEIDQVYAEFMSGKAKMN